MRVIRSIQVNSDSVDLAYMDDVDVRVGGYVVQTHHLSVMRGSNFDDEIDQLEAAAELLVTDVLTDFAVSPAFDLQGVAYHRDDDDDEDEEEG